MSGLPFSKARQLARGKERRRFRHVATPKEWQKIAAAKQGPCRICGDPGWNELHHVQPRSQGGSDVAENILPLCVGCHSDVTHRRQPALRLLAASLTDAEYAYLVEQRGEGGIDRLFGIDYRSVA